MAQEAYTMPAVDMDIATKEKGGDVGTLAESKQDSNHKNDLDYIPNRIRKPKKQ
jgi:hypothetical protein